MRVSNFPGGAFQNVAWHGGLWVVDTPPTARSPGSVFHEPATNYKRTLLPGIPKDFLTAKRSLTTRLRTDNEVFYK